MIDDLLAFNTPDVGYEDQDGRAVCGCCGTYYIVSPEELSEIKGTVSDLYEALREIFDELCGYVELDMSLRIKQALAKAKGKPDDQDEQELDERRLDALLSK